MQAIKAPSSDILGPLGKGFIWEKDEEVDDETDELSKTFWGKNKKLKKKRIRLRCFIFSICRSCQKQVLG